MTTLELYTAVSWGAEACLFNSRVGKLQQYLLQGSRVWFPHEELVWVGGELTKDLKKDGVLEIELETGEVCAVLLLFRLSYLAVLNWTEVVYLNFYFSTGNYGGCVKE